jgi:hypothetical protein
MARSGLEGFSVLFGPKLHTEQQTTDNVFFKSTPIEVLFFYTTVNTFFNVICR